MHLAKLKLRDFRNIRRLDIAFESGFHVLLGLNAQGKTNLLEAVYLLATLRSFRGVGNAQIIRHGQKAFFAGGLSLGETESDICYYWSSAQRKLSVNEKPMRRVADYLGTLRTVVFCAEDALLVIGPAKTRRRFLDLLLTQTLPGYLGRMHRYTEALRSRNALFKHDTPDMELLDSFTQEMVVNGEKIITARRNLVKELSPLVRLNYRKIADKPEDASIAYAPNVREDFAVDLAKSKVRELRYRTTLIGPHRDELTLNIDGQSAAQFASEGQKRTFAIALKMAQADFLGGIHGSPPILLIDDVMGELDVGRRAGLMPLISRTGQALGQVFMTCTEENWPGELSGNLHRWQVKQGSLKRVS
ncbi:MAG TPA: DNA replication/repair protein RecF [Verrucomicrobiota bacterium]|nr:DNA replication/repair protein RecF [Verrucomicrobiota bacterium]